MITSEITQNLKNSPKPRQPSQLYCPLAEQLITSAQLRLQFAMQSVKYSKYFHEKIT